jgi:hypothetical protein
VKRREDPIASLRQAVARGQAAQRAVDQVLADAQAADLARTVRAHVADDLAFLGAAKAAVDAELARRRRGPYEREELDAEFPPWRPCSAEGCTDDTGRPRWTRGAYCPQHQPGLETTGVDRGRPVGRGQQRTTPGAHGLASTARAGTRGRRL